MLNNKRFFIVSSGVLHVITNSMDREGAKINAQPFLAGNPDHYVVSPLTNPGDVVQFNFYGKA
jgi:hypothetical protein